MLEDKKLPVVDKKTQAKLVRQLKKAGVKGRAARQKELQRIGRELVRGLGIADRALERAVQAEIERLRKTGEAERLAKLIKLERSLPWQDRRAALTEAIKAHHNFDTAPYSNMRLVDVSRLLDAESRRRPLNGRVISKIIERLVTGLSHTVLAVEGRPEWMRILNQLSRAFTRILDRVPEIGGVNESLALLHTLARVYPLDEAVEIEPHDELLTERMMLKDYRRYAKLVADAYDARPVREAPALKSYSALRQHNYTMFRRMQSRVRVEFVNYEPYENAADMTRQVEESGTLLISKLHSQNLQSGWSPYDNWVFRAVHDYIVHIGGRHDFSLRGEMGIFNRHAKLVPTAAKPALFSEVVGQVCYALDRKKFPNPQKACVLHGFDYLNVGRYDAEGYKLNFV